ncbi:single-stranded DNA-binding protein [Leucobacter sp. M11]|uniref:single-stranded DNA-binding protein n=1 Tax=Leucobacter sp. M11 TaxID=2993565 RepID=UPI002D80D612|nr:single-stranded DNA-binding protein [Leucobacter sp. M11]MEB4613782.1 single-stranded DNA-binding protein [Leucobacter sp. M11]
MTIRTKESLSGFIANDPELTFTMNGDARLYMRVGQPQVRFEEDGTFTDLDPTFTDLVMFRKSAERAHEQFRKGDNFIAEGDSKTYTKTVKGQPQERDQFVASRIGHDNNITRYTVDRSGPERETPQQEAPARDQARQALAKREAELDPEPSVTVSDGTSQREAVAR